MTDANYVLVSFAWAVYGLVAGFGLGTFARVLWADLMRK